MLYLKKKKEEDSWLKTLLDQASNYGLEEECADSFDKFKKQGDSDAEAALNAAYEWDILDFKKDDDE